MSKLKNVMNLVKKYENVKRNTITISDRLQLQNKSFSIKKNRTKKSKTKSDHITQNIDKKSFVASNTFALIPFKQKFAVMISFRSISAPSASDIATRRFESFTALVF